MRFSISPRCGRTVRLEDTECANVDSLGSRARNGCSSRFASRLAWQTIALATVLSLAVALSGCGDGSSGSGGEDAPAGTAGDVPAGGGGNGSPVPADLVGSWYTGSGYTSAPYNPVTGAWGTPTGKGLVYVFRADGSYTKAFQSYVTNPPCTNGFTAFESGTLQVTATSLTARPTSGRLVVTDTCAPSLDSDDPLTGLEDEYFSWELAPSDWDPAETVLILSTQTAESSFRRL